MTKQEYENMTLSSLKEIAKELGVKNISKYKKNELIDEMIKVSPNSIEKDGVVLRENISLDIISRTTNFSQEFLRSISNSLNIKL